MNAQYSPMFFSWRLKMRKVFLLALISIVGWSCLPNDADACGRGKARRQERRDRRHDRRDARRGWHVVQSAPAPAAKCAPSGCTVGAPTKDGDRYSPGKVPDPSAEYRQAYRDALARGVSLHVYVGCDPATERTDVCQCRWDGYPGASGIHIGHPRNGVIWEVLHVGIHRSELH
jgi:hypothetical protein